MESILGMHWFSLRLQGEIETARTTILTNQVQFDILPGSKPSAASPRIIIESQGNCALTLDRIDTVKYDLDL